MVIITAMFINTAMVAPRVRPRNLHQSLFPRNRERPALRVIAQPRISLVLTGLSEYRRPCRCYVISVGYLRLCHADEATYLGVLRDAGCVVQRREFIPEGDDGHVLLLAQRPGAAAAPAGGERAVSVAERGGGTTPEEKQEWRDSRRTKGCRRLPTAYAPTSLRLLAAPEAECS